ncbi:L-lactate permease [Halovenus sp. WSH3]|uniref:L-lactate permease n=2 Tax=Halovenus carboxidivorans TaxID=2692199 RepID=A0A6B0T7L2_9EURY|nr:L-lactate permease [Halovenus carboxidivorans]
MTLSTVLLQAGDGAIPGASEAGPTQLLLAAVPLLITAVLLVGFLWSATRAMPIAWAAAVVIALLVWDVPLDWVAASSIVGVMTALEILFIVAGALILLYTMLQAGALDRINKGFARVSEDRRVQIVLLGFFMATFIEGAAGFGTPAAVVAPLLLGLGFPALAAVIAAIIGHIIAVTYGAVGTPIIVGIESPLSSGRYPAAIAEGGFDNAAEYAVEVAAWAATYHALVGFMMPLIAVAMVTYFFGEERSLEPTREMIPLCLVAGISFAIPYWISAWFITAEFPSLIGSMVGGAFTVSLLRAGYLLPDDEWTFPDRDSWADHWVGDIEPGGEEMAQDGSEEMSLLKAWSPYILLVVLLVITRAVDAISNPIGNPENAVEFTISGLGTFQVGVVLNWNDILGFGALDAGIGLVSVPGFWLLVSGIAAIGIFNMSGEQVRDAWAEAGQKLVAPFIALIFVIAMVQVMLNTGTYYGVEGLAEQTGEVSLSPDSDTIWRNANMIEVLAVATADALGDVYPFFASLIGALGAAMTGSNTVSNITFAQFQFTAAQQIGVPTQIVVGAQAVGGAIGNLIAIHNLVAALATVGLVGQEGRVIRLNLIPVAYYAFFVGILAMLFSFVVFPDLFTILPLI